MQFYKNSNLSISRNVAQRLPLLKSHWRLGFFAAVVHKELPYDDLDQEVQLLMRAVDRLMEKLGISSYSDFTAHLKQQEAAATPRPSGAFEDATLPSKTEF